MAENQQYLFQVAIGPVQSFIASARRTRDLKFGSDLLSELSKAAAKALVGDRIENLIFPNPAKKEDLRSGTELSVANKIVAIVTGDPQTIGKQVDTAIRERLSKVWTDAYKKIWDIDKDKADKQIEDMVEIFWAAVPLPNQQEYNQKRQLLDSLMAARKNTRDFKPVKWDSTCPKSSIDGQLEGVIFEKHYAKPGQPPSDRKEKALQLYNLYGAGPSERLSGVDLLKRHGRLNTTDGIEENVGIFPSTSHMAAKSFLERLRQIEDVDVPLVREKWNRYIELVKKFSEGYLEHIPLRDRSKDDKVQKMLGNIDGSLLFEERLVDLLDFVIDEQKPDFTAAQERLHEFYEFVDSKLERARPNPYYAILLADGDRMGEVIDHQAKAENGIEKHRDLTRALDGFARGVNDIVTKHKGALIYAGGDDVLALLPLHTAFACGQELAKEFREKLAKFQNKDNQSPTLSAGIVIVHHLELLSEALNLVRAAEKIAKSVDGKNAVAITLSKRSGGDVTVAGKWATMTTNFERLIDYFTLGYIPEGTAYEIREMVLRLAAPTSKAETADQQFLLNLQQAVDHEVKRILERKLEGVKRGLSKEKRPEIDQALKFLIKRIRPEQKEIKRMHDISAPITELVNEMIIASTLADAKQLANPTIKEAKKKEVAR